MSDPKEEKTAEVTVTDDGMIRVTLSDPSGELQTVRVTVPPTSAYKLGEALCMQALKVLRKDFLTEIEDVLKEKPGEK